MSTRSGLESEVTIKFARFFWSITAAMVVGGIVLIAGSGAAGLGPIALVCGALMVWSGIVKAIVLRIWQTTLHLRCCSPSHPSRCRDWNSGRATIMTRRAPGRATRQILSGSELAPPRETIGGHSTDGQPVSFAFRYLVALAMLVVLTAVVWAVWGMPAASAVLLALAVGLIASWLVL